MVIRDKDTIYFYTSPKQFITVDGRAFLAKCHLVRKEGRFILDIELLCGTELQPHKNAKWASPSLEGNQKFKEWSVEFINEWVSKNPDVMIQAHIQYLKNQITKAAEAENLHRQQFEQAWEALNSSMERSKNADADMIQYLQQNKINSFDVRELA